MGRRGVGSDVRYPYPATGETLAADELAQLESLDNGKPVTVARGADIPLAADMFHYMAGWATKIEGNTINISVPYMPGANFHCSCKRVVPR